MGQTIRTALLRKVFSAKQGRRQFDAKLARVCVLFEDLRIEIRGVSERSLPALDVLDTENENWLNPGFTGRYRTFYFLRRSLLTLREFAEALRLIVNDMNQDPNLKPTFQELTNEAKAAWDAGIRFFEVNEGKLNKIRGDIGGHFGHQAALNAVSMLLPTAYGAIAVAQEGASQSNGAASHLKLHFALEIAGTALLGHLPNGDITQYEVLFRDCLLPGYQHAIDCVYVLVREYLWDRFV
jgi:hypothetical protein